MCIFKVLLPSKLLLNTASVIVAKYLLLKVIASSPATIVFYFKTLPNLITSIPETNPSREAVQC
jgi:uncharacterized membrane protein